MQVEQHVDGSVMLRDVTPDEAFSQQLLDTADGRYLRYDGETITIDVGNGRWIWRVVDVDHEALLVHGRWPD